MKTNTERTNTARANAKAGNVSVSGWICIEDLAIFKEMQKDAVKAVEENKK